MLSRFCPGEQQRPNERQELPRPVHILCCNFVGGKTCSRYYKLGRIIPSSLSGVELPLNCTPLVSEIQPRAITVPYVNQEADNQLNLTILVWFWYSHYPGSPRNKDNKAMGKEMESDTAIFRLSSEICSSAQQKTQICWVTVKPNKNSCLQESSPVTNGRADTWREDSVTKKSCSEQRMSGHFLYAR